MGTQCGVSRSGGNGRTDVKDTGHIEMLYRISHQTSHLFLVFISALVCQEQNQKKKKNESEREHLG